MDMHHGNRSEASPVIARASTYLLRPERGAAFIGLLLI